MCLLKSKMMSHKRFRLLNAILMDICFLILVEHLVSLYGSSEDIWSGRWSQIAFVLWKAHWRWGRSRPTRWWIQGIHPSHCWWKRQTRFPNETGCLNQQWVSINDYRRNCLFLGLFCSFEGNWVVHSQFLDTYRYMKVNLFPVSDVLNNPGDSIPFDSYT